MRISQAVFRGIAVATLAVPALPRSVTGQETNIVTRQSPPQCLDIAGGGRANGTRVLTWNCHGDLNQSFHFVRWDSNTFLIKVYGDEMCLDGYKGKGQSVVIYRCDNSEEQRWEVTREGWFRNWKWWSGQRYCMDIRAGSNDAGTDIVLWDCHGGTNQQFASLVFVASQQPPTDLRPHEIQIIGVVFGLNNSSPGPTTLVGNAGAGLVNASPLANVTPFAILLGLR